MTLKLRTLPRFPSNVSGSGVVSVVQANGAYTISLNLQPLLPALASIADPLNTYLLAWNALTGAFQLVQPGAVTSSKSVKILTGGSPYAALSDDDVLIVKQAVGAPFTVTVNWAARGSKPLTIVDGKGDALVNNITVTPTAGQTQLAIVNNPYVIDANGGSVTLTPLPDGTGAY